MHMRICVGNQPRLYSLCKDKLISLLKPGGIAVCIGGNSNGFGLGRNARLVHVVLIPHRNLHPDTLVTVEFKNSDQLDPAAARNLFRRQERKRKHLLRLSGHGVDVRKTSTTCTGTGTSASDADPDPASSNQAASTSSSIASRSKQAKCTLPMRPIEVSPCAWSPSSTNDAYQQRSVSRPIGNLMAATAQAATSSTSRLVAESDRDRAAAAASSDHMHMHGHGHLQMRPPLPSPASRISAFSPWAPISSSHIVNVANAYGGRTLDLHPGTGYLHSAPNASARARAVIPTEFPSPSSIARAGALDHAYNPRRYAYEPYWLHGSSQVAVAAAPPSPSAAVTSTWGVRTPYYPTHPDPAAAGAVLPYAHAYASDQSPQRMPAIHPWPTAFSYNSAPSRAPAAAHAGPGHAYDGPVPAVNVNVQQLQMQLTADAQQRAYYAQFNCKRNY